MRLFLFLRLGTNHPCISVTAGLFLLMTQQVAEILGVDHQIQILNKFRTAYVSMDLSFYKAGVVFRLDARLGNDSDSWGLSSSCACCKVK